ncbi:MAG: transcriptional repressor NrdR [Ruminococcaceae bacterium]|nr:transcriptional repressor NrdR [Oscillospiraceae bacterium]
MKCPFCGFADSKVIDSRPTEEGTSIRRRRECIECGGRFTTYEKLETIPLIVIKSDDSREPFDRHKLLRGIMHACVKRPVPTAKLEELVDDIEAAMSNSLRREFVSKEIGEMVMERLKKLDEVAYVRFASVYRSFQDVDTFRNELNKLLGGK